MPRLVTTCPEANPVQISHVKVAIVAIATFFLQARDALLKASMNRALEQVLSKGQQLKEPPHLFGVAAWHLSHVSQGKSDKKAMQVQMVQHGAAVCTFCMLCDAFIVCKVFCAHSQTVYNAFRIILG